MSIINKAIVPAAGRGTRYHPITNYIPKEMLPIINKPIIHYVIEEAKQSGITDIAIVISKQKHLLEDYLEIFDDLDICYIRQQSPKGLGDAIYKAKQFIGNDPFAILLGDEISIDKTPITKQLIDTFNKWKSPILAVEKVGSKLLSRYGIIDGIKINDRIYKIESIVEKPKEDDAPSNLATIGRYVLTPDIFDIIKDTLPGMNNEIQLTDAINTLSKKRTIYGYLISGKRFDCGSISGYLNAINEFSKIT